LTIPRGAREAGLALIAAGLVLVLLTALANTIAVRGLETASLDLRFRIRGVQKPGPNVALVMVDDRSLAALGRWPFSRRVFAKALQMLDRAGARLIAFDLLFAEPEQPVPADLRADVRAAAQALSGDQHGPLRSALSRIANDDPDGELEATMRAAGRVLLPITFRFAGPPAAAPDYLSDSAYASFDRSPIKPEFALHPVAAGLPIEPLAKAAAGLGSVDFAYDEDGSPRYDYVAWEFDADYLPSLPLRAVAGYLGVPWSEVALVLGEGVRLRDRLIPTDPAMRMLINYRGPRGTFPTYSFVDLVEGRVPADALRGRLVLVGTSVIGLSDSYGAPFGSTPLPGTERLANIIDTMLQGDFIAENPPRWALISLAAVLLLAAATGGAAALVPTRLAPVVYMLPLVGWLGAAQAAFTHGLWLPVVQPVAALVAAIATVLLFRYWVVDREGRRVRSAFRRYLAPDLVTALAAHPERLRLGGETRRMTLLFCDVSGFTTISEQFKANPQGLTQLINQFLTPMTDVILARRGTIDKYMGDCIMAFWNAPLDDAHHADHACDSALAMIRALETLNGRLRREAEAATRPFHALNVGIGLNTGDCVVGNMGSEQRFDYSVLGDSVNLASRLEGLSKTYGVSIVIGEATRAEAPSWASLEIDLVAVKGKHEAVRIYALLGDALWAQSPGFRSLVEAHDRMLGRYRAQDWPAARAALAECRPIDARLTPLYELYETRIAHFKEYPPDVDWDGVFVATTK
jgi:adenylate cyclase